VLILYTDGVTEAENDESTFFGEEQLSKLVQECTELPPEEIINAILQQVRIFTGRHHFNDDISLVVLKILETPERADRKGQGPHDS
jgi:serine phosphatase RsbU (regulator of sigma subunit)